MRVMMWLSAWAIMASGILSAAESETTSAAFARQRQLKTKISVSAKNTPLIDFLKDVAAEAEKQQVKTPKWTYAVDVKRTTPITYSCKDKEVEQILADVFKNLGLGYVVVSKENDKFDGFIRIVLGKERGYVKGLEPTEDDRLASARLEVARQLAKEGRIIPAKAILGRIVKDYPATAAAKEAAKFLETLNK